MLKLIGIGMIINSVLVTYFLLPLSKTQSIEQKTIKLKKRLNTTLVSLCLLDVVGICLYVFKEIEGI